MKNIYLEKLKRMNDEELIKEVEVHGKIMERNHPMTKDEKARALLCFRFALNREDISTDDKMMLATAIRVLRLF